MKKFAGKNLHEWHKKGKLCNRSNRILMKVGYLKTKEDNENVTKVKNCEFVINNFGCNFPLRLLNILTTFDWCCRYM